MMLARLDPRDSAPAAEVLPQEWLDEEAFQVLAAGGNVRAWIGGLVAGGNAAEALQVIARVLPRNYVVAWGCERLRHHLAQQAASPTSEADRVGLALAERCLRNPGTDACEAAIGFAERDNFRCAGAWLAAAAGWLDGGLAPKESGATVPAPDFLPGQAVAAALQMAVRDPAGRQAFVKESIEHALLTFGSGA